MFLGLSIVAMTRDASPRSCCHPPASHMRLCCARELSVYIYILTVALVTSISSLASHRLLFIPISYHESLSARRRAIEEWAAWRIAMSEEEGMLIEENINHKGRRPALHEASCGLEVLMHNEVRLSSDSQGTRTGRPLTRICRCLWSFFTERLRFKGLDICGLV